MQPNRADLADLAYFLAIARLRSFRRAALEFGVTPSALSHALKGFEDRIGVRLLNRTNRSVTLTAAGESLARSIDEPFAEVGDALDRLNDFRDRPGGKIRVNTVVDAAALLIGPVMAELARRYPDLSVELVASNRMVDVIGEGFDAGVRYGGTVPEDMIAQRLSPDLRWVVAGAPAYLDIHGTPAHPDELADHRCLGVRLGNGGIYRWEFTGPDGDFDVAVGCKIVADDSRATLAMAQAGTGLTYGLEAVFARHVAAGELKLVLEDWATTGPGFHLYYPSRRQLPVGLRVLMELIRELRPLS